MRKHPTIRDLFILTLSTMLMLALSYQNGVILRVADRDLDSYTIPLVVGIALASILIAYLRNIDRHNHREREYFFDMAKVLAEALGEKDNYTKGHSLRVTKLSMSLARRIKMREDDLDTLRLSAILHDIGKIGVPGAVLRKTEKLNHDEWLAIMRHPENSEKILQGLSNKRSAIIRNIIRHHHERWDGLGYPDGIKGEEIVIGARIIALADSFDAMTSDRPYRRGLGREVALKEIKKCSNSQFDPALAREFVAMIEEGDITK
ncbi:MAG TPA: HD-GYP domain-containing protein [Desulfobacterales bacterium]|nr:HD-GYP domain-containing protein [Desulfobacterales bacterium]